MRVTLFARELPNKPTTHRIRSKRKYGKRFEALPENSWAIDFKCRKMMSERSSVGQMNVNESMLGTVHCRQPAIQRFCETSKD